MLALAGAGEARTRHASLAYVVTGRSGPTVWLADAHGGHARELGGGESALLSPDGRLVAAEPFGFAGAGVTLFERDGAVEHRFFNASVEHAVPVAWSSDSRYLAVIVTDAEHATRVGLFVIDTHRGSSTQIARGLIAGVSFAPDGSDRVVYGRQALGANFTKPLNIFVSTPSGRSTRELTSDGMSSDPVWGSRGIAFNDAGAPRAGGIEQVWLMRPDGTHRTQLTDFRTQRLRFGLTPLQFSADGTRLLALYVTAGLISQTWAIDLTAHRIRRLTVARHDVIPAGLSRDGESILVELAGSALNNAIETAPFEGGKASVLAFGDAPTWNR